MHKSYACCQFNFVYRLSRPWLATACCVSCSWPLFASRRGNLFSGTTGLSEVNAERSLPVRSCCVTHIFLLRGMIGSTLSSMERKGGMVSLFIISNMHTDFMEILSQAYGDFNELLVRHTFLNVQARTRYRQRRGVYAIICGAKHLEHIP